MIRVENTTNQSPVTYELVVFPASEVHVRVDVHQILPRQNVTIYWGHGDTDFSLQDEIFVVAGIVDAIKYYHPSCRLTLNIGYFMSSRQDRRAVTGDAFSLKIATDFIKTMNLDEIVIVDPHSDVLPALLPIARIVSQKEAFQNVVETQSVDCNKYTGVIAPDNGAVKKASAIANYLGLPLYCASKYRDPVTGALSQPSINLPNDQDAHYLVVDDICDGGFTFIQLAQKIKEQSDCRLDLFVTHGLFTKGKDQLNKYYESIFTR